MTAHGPSLLARLGQGLAVLVVLSAAAASVLFGSVLFGSVVVRSTFGEVADDPHGYGLVLGSFFLVPSAFLGALALPFVARADQPRGRRWAMWAALAWVLAALAIAVYAFSAG